MTLTAPPNPPPLQPNDPFLLTAWWVAGPVDVGAGVKQAPICIAAAEYPGAAPSEYTIGWPLTEAIVQVERSELPITLQLARRPEGWAFDYLGGPEFFASLEHHRGAELGLAGTVAPTERPPLPAPPDLLTPAQLNAQAEAMLRESLGIGPDDPIPEPQGPLNESESSEQPYRFDPTPHMDLGTAEPAPAIPPPAPPGPGPAEGPRFRSPVPEPGRPLGAFGDESVPFAH